jgi:Holliday junction resolvase
MKPEARIKRALRDMLKSEFPQVWTYWPVSNGMGVHGIPDLIMCAGGKFIGVEVKAEGKKVTLLQAHQLNAIEQAAGTALILTGSTAVQTLRVFLMCMHLPRAPDIQSSFPGQMVSLSQDEYDNLMTKNPNTMYTIVDAKP